MGNCTRLEKKYNIMLCVCAVRVLHDDAILSPQIAELPSSYNKISCVCL